MARDHSAVHPCAVAFRAMWVWREAACLRSDLVNAADGAMQGSKGH